ncbi:hypothetical protein AAC387_Pa11g1803 [Persea americana]
MDSTTCEKGDDDYEIVIVGGGICGLGAALALHRKGLNSVVLERADCLRATGSAIGLYTNGWHALDQLRVGTKLQQKTSTIERGRKVSLDNGTTQEFPAGVTGDMNTDCQRSERGLKICIVYLFGIECVFLHGRKEEVQCVRRNDLIETLAEGLPAGTIRCGCHVVGVEMDKLTSFPILRLHDGSVINCKVVISCDGVNSCHCRITETKAPKIVPNGVGERFDKLSR